MTNSGVYVMWCDHEMGGNKTKGRSDREKFVACKKQAFLGFFTQFYFTLQLLCNWMHLYTLAYFRTNLSVTAIANVTHNAFGILFALLFSVNERNGSSYILHKHVHSVSWAGSYFTMKF